MIDIDAHTLPQMEERVLQMLIISEFPDDARAASTFALLTPLCFTAPINQKLFLLIKDKFDAGLNFSSTDILQPILSQLPEALDLIKETRDIASTASLPGYALELLENSRIRAHKEHVKRASVKLDECQTSAESVEILLALGSAADEDAMQDGEVLTHEEAAERAREQRLHGVSVRSTGFTDLDALANGGFVNPSVVTVGAAPSAGKTHFALQLALGITQSADLPGIMFSMEMTAEAISDRIDSLMVNKYNDLITDNEFDALDRKNCKLKIAPKDNVTIEYVRSTCRAQHKAGGLSVVVIDHLDRCAKPSNKDLRSDEKLTEIAKALSTLAKEFNCIVIILTQLNKAAISKDSKRPVMNDSKNSNATAEVSDYWIGLKRIGQWDDGETYEDSNLLEIIVDKNRHRGQGIVYVTCDKPRYGEIDQQTARNMVSHSNVDRKKSMAPKVRSFFDGKEN